MAQRILLVEDDDAILELVIDLLTWEGYEVTGVDHPDAVLAAAYRQHPDLFLIDVMLPTRSGVEVADTLWVNGFAGIPMIAMSASTVMLDLAMHTSLFQAVVSKPFDITDLLETIEQLMTAREPIGFG